MGDGVCLEFFLASFLHDRQSFGHIMYGFNRSFSSARVVAAGQWCWLTFSAEGPTDLNNGRARACSRCGQGCLDIFSLSYHFSFLSPFLWDG